MRTTRAQSRWPDLASPPLPGTFRLEDSVARHGRDMMFVRITQARVSPADGPSIHLECFARTVAAVHVWLSPADAKRIAEALKAAV